MKILETGLGSDEGWGHRGGPDYLYPFPPALQPQYHKFPGPLKTGHFWISSPREGRWSAWGARGNGLSLAFIPGSPGTFPRRRCGFCFVI